MIHENRNMLLAYLEGSLKSRRKHEVEAHIQGCASCRDTMDTNDDGLTDVSDPIYLLNYLYLGGPPPATPYPHCGGDETEDSESCETYTSCDVSG